MNLELLIEKLNYFLNIVLVKTDKGEITFLTLIYLIFFISLVFFMASKIEKILEKRLLKFTSLDSGARHSVISIFKYLFIILCILFIVQNTHLDFSAFSFLAGAVGIGVGFGLQNIVSNFIAGVIILFERPIKIGDRVEINGVEGNVKRIGARSTHVLTNNNITYIVPNSKFITENVINRTLAERLVRFQIPVTVAYGSDFDEVEKLLIQSVENNSNVLKEPAPGVRFLSFGREGINLELRAWSTTQVDRRGRLVSSINVAIYKIFNEKGIIFPNPQVDLHLKSGNVQVIKNDEQQSSLNILKI